jgi:hypothetical protein
VKVEAGRGVGLEVLLDTRRFGLLSEPEETLESGDAGRALLKGMLAVLGFAAAFTIPMGLVVSLRDGVRGGERGTLTCNDPAGLDAEGLSIVKEGEMWARVS